ncbi:winged helix-turn-helix domain-containing protein [Candidatus Woesearchaeota archaeon]|nr:winged helix-turn-helix domain-containing protein [Candidatus Woesearchaeota archaeon]
MRVVDAHEESILKELIRNPRLSDNQLAKQTNIPVTTVNRKRKKLEEEGILSYFAYVSSGWNKVRQLYILKFKEGITIKNYLDKAKTNTTFRSDNARYHVDSYIGEKDGHFALTMILEADSSAELVELFHGKVVKGIRARHGDDCIAEIFTTKIIHPLRLHHNYLPLFNIKNGRMSDTWDSSWIHVPVKKKVKQT